MKILASCGDGKYFENAFYPFLTKKDASSNLFAPEWTENTSLTAFSNFSVFNVDGALKTEREIEIERRLSVAAGLM